MCKRGKEGDSRNFFCHSHPHKINAMCHLTAMEGRGKGGEELGVEEAFAFVLAFRVQVDGQVVLPHPAGRSTNKLFPIVSQRQANDCGALSVSRPLSLAYFVTERGRDSNNGVGTGERGSEWVSETLFCFSSSFADNENDLWPIPWGTDPRSRPLLYGQVEP